MNAKWLLFLLHQEEHARFVEMMWVSLQQGQKSHLLLVYTVDFLCVDPATNTRGKMGTKLAPIARTDIGVIRVCPLSLSLSMLSFISFSFLDFLVGLFSSKIVIVIQWIVLYIFPSFHIEVKIEWGL